MNTRISDDAALSAQMARMRIVPTASTLAGSALALLPFVSDSPVMPPFGLIVLCSWRLLRPEIWPAWVAFLLGLADDLMSGQALGTAATLWTFCFLAFDMIDSRLLWRDYWIDWAIITAATGLCLIGGWLSALYFGSGVPLPILAPQYAVSILCIPPVMRLCAILDHWRLKL